MTKRLGTSFTSSSKECKRDNTMCLIIKDYPQDTTNSLAVKCVKQLNRRPVGAKKFEYRTPYQRTKVPTDGLLYAKGKTRYETRWGTSGKRIGGCIEGGAIHAYQPNEMRHKSDVTSSGEITDEQLNEMYSQGLRFTAYAFGVRAYGLKDLAAKFVYIPECDMNKRRRQKRERMCEQWQYEDTPPNWADVKKLFGMEGPIK